MSKYRDLNTSQINLLQLIHKYRFATRQLIAISLASIKGSALHEKLETLYKQDLLSKRRDIRSIGLNKPIVYYLTPKALKILMAVLPEGTIDDADIRLSYQHKSYVTDDFIAHTLNIYELTQKLQRLHQDLKVFTPRETRQYAYFPEKLPDAFLSLPTGDNNPKRFFFDIVRDRQPRRVVDYKLTLYNEFFEAGGWDETESAWPSILLICEWSPAERSIQRSTSAQLDRLGSDLRVYTSTALAVSKADNNKAIWTDVSDTDELMELATIPINP
jgi:hypothetical protein